MVWLCEKNVCEIDAYKRFSTIQRSSVCIISGSTSLMQLLYFSHLIILSVWHWDAYCRIVAHHMDLLLLECSLRTSMCKYTISDMDWDGTAHEMHCAQRWRNSQCLFYRPFRQHNGNLSIWYNLSRSALCFLLMHKHTTYAHIIMHDALGNISLGRPMVAKKKHNFIALQKCYFSSHFCADANTAAPQFAQILNAVAHLESNTTKRRCEEINKMQEERKISVTVGIQIIYTILLFLVVSSSFW